MIPVNVMSDGRGRYDSFRFALKLSMSCAPPERGARVQHGPWVVRRRRQSLTSCIRSVPNSLPPPPNTPTRQSPRLTSCESNTLSRLCSRSLCSTDPGGGTETSCSAGKARRVRHWTRSLQKGSRPCTTKPRTPNHPGHITTSRHLMQRHVRDICAFSRNQVSRSPGRLCSRLPLQSRCWNRPRRSRWPMAGARRGPQNT